MQRQLRRPLALLGDTVSNLVAGGATTSSLGPLPTLPPFSRGLHPVARSGGNVEITPEVLRDTLIHMSKQDPAKFLALKGQVIDGLDPSTRAEVFRLSYRALEAQAGGEDTLDSIFMSSDTNADGMLTKDEFKNAVTAYNTLSREGEDGSPASVSGRKLMTVAIVSGVPFVTFGFMDNAGMLVFGEVVDVTVGGMLGLTAMASAACGNLISDVIGVSLSQTIDQKLRSMGLLKEPGLTAAQKKLPRVQRFILLGSMVGIAFGGVLGMFPLLFMGG